MQSWLSPQWQTPPICHFFSLNHPTRRQLGQTWNSHSNIEICRQPNCRGNKTNILAKCYLSLLFFSSFFEKPKHHHHDHPLRQVTWPMVSDHVCRWLPIKQEADTRQGATILQPIATIAAFSGFAEIETNCNICINCNHLATNCNQLQPIAGIEPIDTMQIPQKWYL